MALFLINGSRLPVLFEKSGDLAFAYPALTGSEVWKHQSSTLSLEMKQLVTSLFTLRFTVFNFLKNQMIESISQRLGLYSRIVIKGELHYWIEGFENIHQQEGTAFMLWGEEARCTALFEADKEYRALDIFIAPDLVKELSQYFTGLPINWDSSETQVIAKAPVKLSPALEGIINGILDCPYDIQTSRFYFDLKVREFLLVMMEEQLHQTKSKYKFTPFEVEQIRKAREILLSDVQRPPPKIRDLARQVSLNEFRLKEGFKHFYQSGVFETFHVERMKYARDLLLETNKPIKEICGLAGYSRVTSFITAFRHYFGQTPGDLRRR